MRKIGRALAVAVLFTGVLTALAPAAQATSLPYPDTITAQVIGSQAPTCDPNTCGTPTVIVEQKVDFTLRIALSAGSPAENAAFNTSTKLTLSESSVGSLSVNSVTMPAGEYTHDFALNFSTFTNDVTITVSVGKTKGKASIPSADSNTFDVLKFVTTAHGAPNSPFTQGTSEDGCATVSDTNPVCGIVTFQNGTESDVLLAEGSCANIGCDTRGLVAEVVADMGTLYGPEDPATLLIKCYRTVCGQGGKTKVQVYADITGDGPLQLSPACPAKGVVAPPPALPFCTDYVQSTRAGADLTLLYVLFYDDFRGSA
jgi:hypothetical protein